MSTAEILQQIRTLSPEQRREVIGRIQEEFGGFEPELTPVQAAELDWRLEEHAARPDDVVHWSRIKAETEAKYSRKS
jgi:hypothetical protein